MLAALIALLLGGAAFALSGGGTASAAPAASTPPATDDDDDDDDAVPPPPSDGDNDSPDLPASAYALGWGGLTAEEQLVVELVNRARMDPAAEVNRLDEGLASGITPGAKAPLAVTPELSEASRAHSDDMDDRNFFAHTNPDGDQPWDRAIDEGHGSSYVGENIAVIGSSSTNFDEQARVEALHQGLWESDGHQRNLMRDDWTEIGTGYDYGNWEGYPGSTFLTEMFSDRGHTYLTGVVIDDADGDEFYDIGEGQGGVRLTAIDEADATKVYATSTWDAGGYTLRLPPGTYRVIFEGGDLDSPEEARATIGGDNVKLDVIEDGAGSPVVASAVFVAGGGEETGAMLPALPPVDDDTCLPVDPDEEDGALEPALL